MKPETKMLAASLFFTMLCGVFLMYGWRAPYAVSAGMLAMWWLLLATATMIIDSVDRRTEARLLNLELRLMAQINQGAEDDTAVTEKEL